MTEITTWTYTAEHSGARYPAYEIIGTIEDAKRAAMERFGGDLDEVKVTIYRGAVEDVQRYGKSDCLALWRRLGGRKWQPARLGS